MRTSILRAMMAAVALVSAALAIAQNNVPTGNVVFLHPDGTGLNHWNAARMYWAGPDAMLNWDRMPGIGIYRGHMADQLSGTSNGGATVHAFGYKVEGRGSFGKDGDGNANPPTDRAIRSLSGFPGSIMREAAKSGHPVGVINDGHIGEPGTGAFLAEVGNRNNWEEITKQMLMGRPGQNDPRPVVIMGGGEEHMLPTGTAGVHGPGRRTDSLDLIDALRKDGYEIVRTRTEFEALRERLRREPNWTPRVLGVFGRYHLYNDENEEKLIADGFVRAPEAGKERFGDLVLWGSPDPNSPSFNPPKIHEMMEVALMILDRHRASTGKHFLLVAEPESTDNFGNNTNAIGVLTATYYADLAIGEVLKFIERDPRTLLLTAADSDAGGMQVIQQRASGNVAGTPANPAQGATDVSNPIDGIRGRGTAPFVAMPDAAGNRLAFGINWAGTPDFAGGIISRAAGVNANLMQQQFGGVFDNTDVYRLIHATLYGRLLPAPKPPRAPDR